MQIVRDLAGYTLGGADVLRRAMSKKKEAVMQAERKRFVYGDEDGGVPGCVRNGINEKVANKIYDDMIDFAKYAFNKSHAAAYAVVSYHRGIHGGADDVGHGQDGQARRVYPGMQEPGDRYTAS